jgi:putative serine/threonine protein kinase
MDVQKIVAQLTDKRYLAHGKRGIASIAQLDGKTVLVKEKNPRADVDTVAHEANMLKLVNSGGIGPRYIAHNDAILVREFADGPEINDWIAHAEQGDIRRVLIDILRQCKTLDEMYVNKLEMTHPHKHILIVKDGDCDVPVMIDFDRARHVERPKNVTQACQWITSATMDKQLRARAIVIDRVRVRGLAQTYKNSYDRNVFNEIINEISGTAA